MEPLVEVAEQDHGQAVGIVHHRLDKRPGLAAAADYREPQMRRHRHQGPRRHLHAGQNGAPDFGAGASQVDMAYVADRMTA